jgi:hypothetical protein
MTCGAGTLWRKKQHAARFFYTRDQQVQAEGKAAWNHEVHHR